MICFSERRSHPVMCRRQPAIAIVRGMALARRSIMRPSATVLTDTSILPDRLFPEFSRPYPANGTRLLLWAACWCRPIEERFRPDFLLSPMEVAFRLRKELADYTRRCCQ